MKKLLVGAYQPFFIYTIIMVFYHLMMKENPILDTMRYFAVALDECSLSDYLTARYATWTSRIFIEAPIVILARHLTIWKILDIVIMLLIPVALSKIFGCLQEKKYNYLICGFVLLYPFQDMGSTGWLSTCMNYTWVLAFALAALVPLAKQCRNETLTWVDYLLGTVPLLYAANMEQMCAILLVTVACALLWLFLSKRKCGILVPLQFLICVAQLANIMYCPGNRARTTEELSYGIKDYLMYDTLDKIYLGINDTLDKLFDANLLFFVFALLFFILVTVKCKNVGYSILAGIPVFYALRAQIFGAFFPNFLSYMDTNYQMSVETYMNGTGYLMLAFQLLPVLCLILEIVMLSDNFGEWLFMTLVLGMGFASRVVMGFSPTLYSSGNRTFLYFYFCMIFAAIYYVRKNAALLCKYAKLTYAMEAGFGVAAIMSACNAMAYMMLWD